jgi:small-conductance mechanosensitive channel/CRP-like cAMP-binding protein
VDFQLQHLLNSILQLFTAPLFHVGDTAVSLSLTFGVLVALFVVVFLASIFKNFLRKRLLVKLGMDEGNRAAIATIISYSTGTLGFIIVLQSVGLNLASLVLVAGGLGVGIGFGLQDATKNFVSGLTLLIERKLKVGDFVEFEGLSGHIKEISIRSTLIRTLDGSDVIVPNSFLVENRLVNWSYDNCSGRIRVPVRVEFDTDPLLVTEVLARVAYAELDVLHDYPPEVIFKGFGDSALLFELWVWINRIDLEPQIKSALYFRIERDLRLNGIKVPLVQTEMWLKNPEVLLNHAHKIEEASKLPQQKTDNGPLPKLYLRDMLRQIAYFQNFSDLELRQLIEVGYSQNIKAGEILFLEDEPGDAFYIILSGTLEVKLLKLDKQIAMLQMGDFVGELALMLDIPRTATVQAVEDTTLFTVNRHGFEKLLHNHPNLSELIAQELCKRQEELALTQQQLKQLGLTNPHEDSKNLILWVRQRLSSLFNL